MFSKNDINFFLKFFIFIEILFHVFFSSSNLINAQEDYRLSPEKKEILLSKINFIEINNENIEYDYNRKDWGSWINKKCNSTRVNIIIKYAKEYNYNNCRLISGIFIDMFTNKEIKYNKIDIDHIVPLRYINNNGGYFFSKEKKNEVFNDYENLLPVNLNDNRRKGSKGVSEFMPEKNRCLYIEIWINILNKYNLTVYPNDKIVLFKELEKC